MSLSTTAELEDAKARNKQLIAEVLEAYPEKYAKRAPSILAPSRRESPTAA